MLSELKYQKELPGILTLEVEGLPRIWVASLNLNTRYFTSDRGEALQKQQDLWRFEMGFYKRECPSKRYARENLAIITQALEEI